VILSSSYFYHILNSDGEISHVRWRRPVYASYFWRLSLMVSVNLCMHVEANGAYLESQMTEL